MPASAPVWSRLSRCILIAALCGSIRLSAQTAPRPDGIGFVTSTRGYVATSSESTLAAALAQHDSLTLSGQSIQTNADGQVCLALSNGLGLGIGTNTRVHVPNFEQSPFAAEKESVAYEPSHSQLALELQAGTIALAGSGNSPLSELTVTTPHGHLRIHSGNCQIRYQDAETQIISYTGNLTFTFADEKGRAFLPQNSQLRITTTSAQNGQIEQKRPHSELAAGYDELQTYAQNAHQRVLFKAPKNGETSTAIQIVSAEYFEQDPARPYTYREQ